MRALVALVALAALVGGCASAPAPRPKPAGDGVRYLAIGDSLTQGVGAFVQENAFPAVLAQTWRAQGCDVELHNIGIGGYTSAQILSDEVPRIDEFQPTVITFQAGANDVAKGVGVDEYRKNVQATLDAATKSGARVVVIPQNEWFRGAQVREHAAVLAPKRAEFDEVLLGEAQARGVEVVDLRPLFTKQADQNMFAADGIHPTPDAYAAWAKGLADAVPAPCK